jgi:hypothetical protein
MFAPPSSALVAGLQSIPVAALFLTLGWLIAGLFPDGKSRDAITDWGLAFGGICVFGLVMMLAHMASGGRILSEPWIVRVLTIAVMIGLAIRRIRRRGGRYSDRRSRKAAWIAGGLVLIGLMVWCSPVVRMLPLSQGGDTVLRTGETAQLMNGETTPSAPLTGPIPNSYPWMFHVVTALVATFTPGARPHHALAPLQLIQVAGSILALFALGRTIWGKLIDGAAASLLGGLTGGIGFLLLRRLDIVLDPRTEGMRYFGDLLFKRSYNAAFLNIAPPFPRDIALTLFLTFLLALALALKGKRPTMFVGAGIVLGLVGLTGAETFLVGFGLAVAVSVFPLGLKRRTVGASLLLPALAVYSVWLVPQVINYVRLGGYVNITETGPVSLNPAAILVSWGIVTPFAILGLFRRAPEAHTDPGARLVLIATLVSAGFVLISSAIPAILGSAFLTLGRAHRYWPLLQLCLALYAAAGLSNALEHVARFRPAIATVVGAVVLVIAVASPTIASLAMPREFSTDPLLASAVKGRDRSLLNILASNAGEQCNIAVPLDLDSMTYSYTGFRHVMFTWLQRSQNKARIRWKNIYDVIVPEARRLRDNEALTRGWGGVRKWTSIAEDYGLDIVVVPIQRTSADAFKGHPLKIAADAPFGVVQLHACEA